jgi:hypothetical protein
MVMTTLPGAWPCSWYPTASWMSWNGYVRLRTGVTAPTSMSPVSVMRVCFSAACEIHHALHALGSRALGFSQELFDPSGGVSDEETAAALDSVTAQIPHLAAMFMEVAHDDPETTLGWCDDQTEFEFGLDLILDGLDKMRKTA